MRLLVIANTAGIMTPVAKYMNDNGHEARIVQRKAFEQFGLTEESGCGILVDSPSDLYKEIRSQIENLRPDVIHVNSIMKGLVVARYYAPSTPIVFTYCGTDVRGRRKAHPETSLADLVTVATPDLQKYGLWIDRAIDPMFYYRRNRKEGTAFGIYADYWLKDTRPLMQEWCDKRGVELTLLDRTNPDHTPIEHHHMPTILSSFEYYLDFKGITGALSRAAIEAIACGCKVIHDSDLDKDITRVSRSTSVCRNARPIVDNTVLRQTDIDTTSIFVAFRSRNNFRIIQPEGTSADNHSSCTCTADITRNSVVDTEDFLDMLVQ